MSLSICTRLPSQSRSVSVCSLFIVQSAVCSLQPHCPSLTPSPLSPLSADSPSRRSSVDRSARGMQLPPGSATSASATSASAGAGDRRLSPPAGSGDAADSTDSPLAFTVDFGPADKRLHVKDSISRWAPRTRRSAAASKDDREEVRTLRRGSIGALSVRRGRRLIWTSEWDDVSGRVTPAW